MAAEHLLDLGHTYIGHISGPLTLRVARERLAGFHQAIRDRGLEPGPCVGGEGNWECAYGYEVVQPILQQHPRPTAIFAANDRMAIGAMQAASQAGLQVPGDISIIGLDDLEFAAFQIPPLTTLRQPFTDLGTLAVKMLIDLIEGREPAQSHFVLDPTLVIRESTTRLG
jgi:LacI family transcriptional regulator